jgi:alpha-tubulin suppressor-like RCC1 family protein
MVGIFGGGAHTCAITQVGGLKCWGYNQNGQLGNSTSDNYTNTPVNVWKLSSGVMAGTAGSEHTCALAQDGGVKCWGDNWYGQLGNGTRIDKNTPVDVLGLTSGVVAVSAGGGHTCAVTDLGGVKCWGYNKYGQLGNGTYNNSSTAVDVLGLTSGAVAVSAGGGHTCAVTDLGGVKCWGNNKYGQLGNGIYTDSPTAVDVLGLTSGVVAVSAGNYHTCALTSIGEVKCWGYNYYGQLGNGSYNDSSTPVDVLGLTSGVVAVSAGGKHTCVLTDGGGVECWGYNYYGQLGNGEIGYQTTAGDVVGLILW